MQVKQQYTKKNVFLKIKKEVLKNDSAISAEAENETKTVVMD